MEAGKQTAIFTADTRSSSLTGKMRLRENCLSATVWRSAVRAVSSNVAAAFDRSIDTRHDYSTPWKRVPEAETAKTSARRARGTSSKDRRRKGLGRQPITDRHQSVWVSPLSELRFEEAV
jgi:hypothetical protein